jgi:hypothetical protein
MLIQAGGEGALPFAGRYYNNLVTTPKVVLTSATNKSLVLLKASDTGPPDTVAKVLRVPPGVNS